jgi:molybdopterin-binding protein
VVDGTDLAAFAVSSAAAWPEEGEPHRSPRNAFPGIVTRVVRGDVVAQVEIQAGPHRIVSVLTTEAVDELGLEPGVEATAVVKATNVHVERR